VEKPSDFAESRHFPRYQSDNTNALNSQPAYCYTGQQDDVMRFCRKIFVMSPMRVVSLGSQIRVDDFPEPIFFFVKDHPRPVPQDVWDFLAQRKATYVELRL
jgi:hypothetical protein